MRHSRIERALWRRARFERMENRLVFSTVPGWDEILPPSVDWSEETLDWQTANSSTADFYSLDSVQYVRDKYGLYGSGQTVAIIDSGIAYDHLALGGGFGTEYRVVGGADFTEEQDLDPYDDGPAGFHGTHVAGIVASQDAQHLGVAPNVDLVALRVFNDFGSGYLSWVESALQWVHQHRNDFRFPITTVNLSLGTSWNGSLPPAGAQLEDEFAQLEQDGIFISVAAGNSFAEYQSTGLSYPAASPHVVPVASVGADGTISDFSQRNSRVLAAPGEQITSSVPDAFLGADGYANDWMAASGTSMAAPFIAGGSVLVREAFEFLGMASVDQTTIYEHLITTADTIYDPVTQQSYSRVNLGQAIDALLLEDDFGSQSADAFDLGVLADQSQLSGHLSALDDRDVFEFTAAFDGQVTLSAEASQFVELAVAGQAQSAVIQNGEQQIDVEAGKTYLFSLSVLDRIATFDVELTLEPATPFQIDGHCLIVEGTDADDDVTLFIGNYIEVGINGETLRLPEIDQPWQIQFVGYGGQDKLTIRSHASNNLVKIRSGFTEYSDTATALTADSFEFVNVTSYGGQNDAAHLHGTAGNDLLEARTGQTCLSGTGYRYLVVGFDRVYASAHGGEDDVAFFDDSAGDDLFTGRNDYSLLQGEGYYNKAYGFDRNYVRTTTGRDVAKLYDSLGDDIFVGRPDYSYMRSSTTYNKVYGFDQVYAHASAGMDIAKLYDSAGDDMFLAYPTDATLRGENYYLKTLWFEQNYAHSSTGTDIAKFYDSAGNDRFISTPLESCLRGEGFYNKAHWFSHNYSHASDGNDTALFYDSVGDDRFIGQSDWSLLRGEDFYNKSHWFEVNRVFSSSGYDVAQLYDSAGDDLFVGGVEMSYFARTNGRTETHGFREVLAVANLSGNDMALLGSLEGDRFSGVSEWAVLEDSDSRIEAQGFAQVKLEVESGELGEFDLTAVDYLFSLDSSAAAF
jgi:hypothetical protein